MGDKAGKTSQPAKHSSLAPCRGLGRVAGILAAQPVIKRKDDRDGSNDQLYRRNAQVAKR